MKRIAIIISLMTLTMSTFAQNKGEKYIGLSVSASFGKQYANYTTYYNIYNASKPLSTSVMPTCEFAYFPADHFRIAAAIGVPFDVVPDTQYGTNWTYDYSLGVSINPNMAYYVRLADRFYYAPEFGIRYEIGKTSSAFPNLFDDQTPLYYGFSTYLNFLAFEFRVNEKFALNMGVGSVYYTFAKRFGSQFNNSWWQFDFNSATVSALFYL